MSRFTAKIFAASGDRIREFSIHHPSINIEVTEAAEYEPCDIAVVEGAPRHSGRKPERIATRNRIYSEHKGILVAVETGFIGRQFAKQPFSRMKSLLGFYQRNKSTSPYLRVGLGGAFGDDADFCNDNSPGDRWERMQKEFDLSIKPWRTDGRHILLIGQVPNDASLKGCDICQWLVDTAYELKKHTSRPVKVRLHPRTAKEEAVPLVAEIKAAGATLSDPIEPIWNDLRGSWACVTFSSSACVEAMLAGIPTICTSPASIGYKVTSNSVVEIEQPEMTLDREQWFRNLSYAQWNADEIASGEAWRHLQSKALSLLPKLGTSSDTS